MENTRHDECSSLSTGDAANTDLTAHSQPTAALPVPHFILFSASLRLCESPPLLLLVHHLIFRIDDVAFGLLFLLAVTGVRVAVDAGGASGGVGGSGLRRGGFIHFFGHLVARGFELRDGFVE